MHAVDGRTCLHLSKVLVWVHWQVKVLVDLARSSSLAYGSILFGRFSTILLGYVFPCLCLQSAYLVSTRAAWQSRVSVLRYKKCCMNSK